MGEGDTREIGRGHPLAVERVPFTDSIPEISVMGEDDPSETAIAPDTIGSPSSTRADLDKDELLKLKREFWLLVTCFNIALLAGWLGLLLLVFERGPDLGIELLASGVILGGYGYARYRWGPRTRL